MVRPWKSEKFRSAGALIRWSFFLLFLCSPVPLALVAVFNAVNGSIAFLSSMAAICKATIRLKKIQKYC